VLHLPSCRYVLLYLLLRYLKDTTVDLQTELVPNKHKLLGMAIVLSFCLPGTALGALIARALVELANWRYLYYIYIIAQGMLDLQVLFYTGNSA
jgi:trichothecene efflux pump TRI12